MLSDHACRPSTSPSQPGFEIGWDYAHYRLVPPPEHLLAGNPVRDGWEAGQAVFGLRTLRPTPQVKKWLQLRLGAWMRGKHFDLLQVTPNFLRRIELAACPITGEALTQGTGLPSDASVDRVNNQAGYAVGNLAVMSVRANQAKSLYGWRDCAEFARQIEVGGLGQIDGLSAACWARLAALASLCTPLIHAEAACLPLLVLPPPRLRVINPAQALQVVLTLRYTRPGRMPQADRLEALFPRPARTALRSLMTSLLARRIAAGPGADAAALGRAMQNAWASPQILRHWQKLAMSLGEAACERIVEQAATSGLADPSLRCLPLEAATDGWALQSEGRVTEEVVMNADSTDEVSNGWSPPAVPIDATTPARRMAGQRLQQGLARLAH